MSQKITSKNLTYDSSLPPFLARLRGQQAGRSGPDPILAAHRRPGQKRSASEEAEDAPVVVDEHGNVVALEGGQLPGEEEEGDGTKEADDGRDDNDEKKESPEANDRAEKVAGIGTSRKRKVGRVVGEEEASDDEKGRLATARAKKNVDDEARIAKASADIRRLVRHDDDDDDDGTSSADTRKQLKTTKDGNASNKAGNEPQQQQQQQKKTTTIKSAKKKTAKKIKLSFGDDDDGGE